MTYTHCKQVVTHTQYKHTNIKVVTHTQCQYAETHTDGAHPGWPLLSTCCTCVL